MIGHFYEVEKILGKRKTKDDYEYLIKWKGYSLTECTWEPMSHLQYVKDYVDKFNASLDGADNSADKENQNLDNKNNGKKKVLQRKRKLMESDEEEYKENDKNIQDKKEKENKPNNFMNETRMKLRSSDQKFAEKNIQKEKEIEQEKEKEKEKENEKKEVSRKRGGRNRKRFKGRYAKANKKGKKVIKKPEPNVDNNLEEDEINKDDIEDKKEENKGEENKTEENLEKKEEEKEDNLNKEDKNQEKKKFFIDDNYSQILGIKMENKNLIAVVEKKVNGKINQELLSTKELRFLNPWILIDYYDNRINFE